MSTGRFRFAADILRRLGEELNPSPDQGILELVKNAYDADARHCSIELIDTDEPGGTVRVTDDGDGMTDSEIVDGWLVLGKSPKVPQKLTRLHRHPAGSKGLGRLAALRMGTKAILTTRPRRNPANQYSLEIDWTKYDGVRLVDDVPLTIRGEPAARKSRPGTTIVIRDLHVRIGRVDVKKLARGILLLADPFADDPGGFRPVLQTPEFADLEHLVRHRYFDDADYHLAARLDRGGRAQARVLDDKGKVLFQGTHKDLAVRRDGRSYQAPATSFDLWVFILTKATFEVRTTTLAEVRDWLTQFGGVHVYQNGIRVAPYGNPGNDWLDMNLRRARSPEERPSTNTSIGRLAVYGGDNALVQKTDRSGFIESEAFLELRTFAQDALDWMARRRLDHVAERRARKRVETATAVDRARKRVESRIASLPPRAQSRLAAVFGSYDKAREHEATQLRKEVQLYRTLSTAGITAATFAHESSGNPIKVVAHSINVVERRARKELATRYDEVLKRPVESIRKAIDSLSVLGNATLSLIDHDKRRLRRVNIHDVIRNILRTFDPFLRGRDVAVELELVSGDPYLRASEAALESIVTNLLNNSLSAFEQSKVMERRILIATTLLDGHLSISLKDNGPGITGIELRDIWLPGETTRPNGTGLGLTIVRDTVFDLGGTVDAEAHSDLGGAHFTIALPILGS